MQHIQGQNYVKERLEATKRKGPGALVWFMTIGMVLAVIGIVGFALSLLTTMFLSLSQSPSDFQSSGMTIPISFVIAFVMFAIAFVGALVAGISASLLGYRQITLKQVIQEWRGGDTVGRLEAGLQGEQEVVSTLVATLDNQWTLFSGVVIDGMWGDIDHVLIGPAGVFAIETKNWSGTIKYDDERRLWYRVSERNPNGEILKDPTEQAAQGANALQGLIGQRVTPVVVFTNRNAVYQGDHPTISVLTLPHLVPWLQAQPHIINSADVNNLVEKIKHIIK